MFYGCTSLTDLDLSNFNTKNDTNMNNMFDGCNSLTNINFANFNTQNVSNIRNIFYGCTSLINFIVLIKRIYILLNTNFIDY